VNGKMWLWRTQGTTYDGSEGKKPFHGYDKNSILYSHQQRVSHHVYEACYRGKLWHAILRSGQDYETPESPRFEKKTRGVYLEKGVRIVVKLGKRSSYSQQTFPKKFRAFFEVKAMGGGRSKLSV